jgi:hypothetical protein
MTGAHSVPAASAVACVVANLTLNIAQFVRFGSEQGTWTRWSYWATRTRWSIIQALCYIIAVIVPLVLWQKVPNVSHVAFQCLLDVCWLNSVSGQVCHQALQGE